MPRFVNAPNIQNFVNAAVSRVRYFLGFDPTLNSYGQLSTAFTPAGSFKIKGKFSTTSTDTQWLYSRWDSSSNDRSVIVQYFGGNGVRFYISSNGSSSINIEVSYTPIGKFSTFEATFNANSNIILTVDGVTVTTTHSIASVYDADTPVYFGSNTGSSNFLQGVLADIELIDLAAPANSQAYRLDRATGTTESSLVNTGTLTYNNIPEADREQFKLVGATNWINISPAPQQLPATLQVP